MKKKWIKVPFFCLQILIYLLINWGGEQLVSQLDWPVWLDTVGTVLAAYMLGPWCGAVVGATSNLLAHILYGVPWYYCVISILIGLITGFAARKKMLDNLLDIMTTSVILAVVAAFGSYPMNLLLNGGDIGNSWGNAVMGYLGEIGLPIWVGMLVGELYVELLDKLVILVAMFLIIRLIHLIRRKTKGKETTETDPGTPVRAAALLLACALSCSTQSKVRSLRKGPPAKPYLSSMLSIASAYP